MKKLILIYLLCLFAAATAFAEDDRYVIVTQEKSASTNDQQALANQLAAWVDDVPVTNAAIWVNSFTNQCSIVAYDVRKDSSPTPPLSLTKAQIDAWKDTPGNLAEPAKVVVLTGDDAYNTLIAGGFYQTHR